MTPRPLLLVGAGGLAREVLAAVRLQPSEWKPIGALDDDPSKHGADLDGVPVLGGSEVAGELTDALHRRCFYSYPVPSHPSHSRQERDSWNRLRLTNPSHRRASHPRRSG